MEQPLDASSGNAISAVLASFVTGAFGVFIWLMTRKSEWSKKRAEDDAEAVESERKARVDLWDSMKELYERLQERNDAQVARIGALETERFDLLGRILRLEAQVRNLQSQTEDCRRENAAFRAKLFDLTGDSDP